MIVYENYDFGILHNKLDNFIGRDWAKVNYCLQLNESFERNSSQRDKLILFTGQSMTLYDMSYIFTLNGYPVYPVTRIVISVKVCQYKIGYNPDPSLIL